MNAAKFPPSPDRLPPAKTEIVVIGGGVVGVTAALTLAEWGIPVVLCEKGRIAGEQSSRNWGWIRIQGRDLREVPLMLESQAMWRQYSQRCRDSFGLRERGIAYVAATDEELAGHESWLERVRPFQLASRMLGPSETDEILGREDRQFKGAILTPSDMHAEPALAVPAIAQLAAEAGVQIFEETAVRALETADGSVTGVITEHGRIGCKGTILAGGAWCRPFLENMGLSLPQLAVRSQAQRTAPARQTTGGPIGAPRASIRPRLDGGYTIGRTGAARFDLIPAAFAHFHRYLPILRDRWRILKIRLGPEFFGALGRHRWGPDQLSPMEQARTLDPEPDTGILDSTLAEARAIFPQLRDVPVLERWGGMIEVSPDEVPLLGEIGGYKGLTLASGLSGHGFGLGPGLGLLAAQLATGRAPVSDPAPFAVDRF